MRNEARWALAFGAALTGACGVQPIVLDDRDGGGAFTDASEMEAPVLQAIPEVLGSVALPGGWFTPPPWTSPDECPTPSDDAYCAPCFAWTDGGPQSLDRNESGDRFGAAVALADFNGDGYPDLAVGAPGEDTQYGSSDGRIYVFLGSERGLQPWTALRPTDFSGDSSDASLGGGLAAGDFDDDGYADLAIGPEGMGNGQPQVVVAYGSARGFVRHAMFRLKQIDPDEYTEAIPFGSVVAAGDLNGDGIDDLAIGAPEYPVDSLEQAGAVFVMYGATSGLAPGIRVDLWTAGIGPWAWDRFGASIAIHRRTSGPDLLVVGTPGYGWVLVFAHTTLVAGPYWRPDVPKFGRRVAVGDLTNDGTPEILVGGENNTFMTVIEMGAMSADVSSFDTRGTWALVPLAVVDLDDDGDADVLALSEMLNGEHALLLYHGNGTIAPDDWVLLEGADRESYDALGVSAAAADLDGDGFPEVVGGAAAPGTSGAGRVHVFRGDAGDFDPPAAVDMVDQELALPCDTCTVHSFPDGTVCGGVNDGMICVGETCVARGCGDGYREPAPGTLEWPRESCDDGNLEGDDACSSSCETQRLLVSTRSLGDDAPAALAPSVAADGSGRLLFVYVADTGDTREVRARRYSARGVPLDGGEPIVLAADAGLGWDAQPNVAALPFGGWLVVWTDPTADGDAAGIAMRYVRADGLLSTTQVVNEDARGAQREGRIAVLDDGWVVVWTDESGLDGPLGGSIIEARRFEWSGHPMGGEWAVSALDVSASQPTLAVGDGRWIVAWSEASEEDGSVLMGRRFGGAAPDEDAFVLSEDGGSTALTRLPGGDVVAAWVGRAEDHLGDIFTRTVAMEGDPLDGSTVVQLTGPTLRPRAEIAPSVAALSATEYLVAYEDGGTRRGLAFAHVGMSALVPEALDLADYLVDGWQGDVTLLRTPQGIWFAWSDASFGDPEAYRSFVAYLLPLD